MKDRLDSRLFTQFLKCNLLLGRSWSASQEFLLQNFLFPRHKESIFGYHRRMFPKPTVDTSFPKTVYN